ncbi:hypothetical protein [Thermosyntropha sp.]|uniref:hypothetical protein n=1 Tax=Thermosyntropha sp. TaxID=2740820 RepID=UPI0025F9C37A|nr:hypothetical protein [Thermosyntropha sp.]MBO8159335.1 hypothetical protein [Thermosyntropha sp.]
MRIYSAEPLSYRKKRVKIPLRGEDIRDENAYDEIWLFGDDKEGDIYNLIEQNRLKKY